MNKQSLDLQVSDGLHVARQHILEARLELAKNFIFQIRSILGTKELTEPEKLTLISKCVQLTEQEI